MRCTNGVISMQLLLDLALHSDSTDRTMGGPTTQMWIDPWIALLERLGVALHAGHACTALEVENGRVARAHFANGEAVGAPGDQFILAVPLEVAQPLMNDRLCALDPQCARLRSVDVEGLVSRMVGIQFFLYEDVPVARGHMLFPDAPWAVTAISQPQFWRETVGPFSRTYGAGDVSGLISVDISEWHKPGTFVKKKAIDCTPEEIKEEIWEQLKAGLNGSERDQQILTDQALHSWHLDADLDYSQGLPARNTSGLLIHPPGSWANRPEPASSIPNLTFAADYVRTHTDLASMEAANEAARRATNAILDREQSSAPRAGLWPLEEPPLFARWRQLDAELYRIGPAAPVRDCRRPRSVSGGRSFSSLLRIRRAWTARHAARTVQVGEYSDKRILEILRGPLTHCHPERRAPLSARRRTSRRIARTSSASVSRSLLRRAPACPTSSTHGARCTSRSCDRHAPR